MSQGQLSTNVMHFARLLRRAGLKVGPADMLAAQQALSLVEIGDKQQMQAALRATMVHRHEDADLFDYAFSIYWRDPNASQQARAMAAIDGRRKPRPVPNASKTPSVPNRNSATCRMIVRQNLTR